MNSIKIGDTVYTINEISKCTTELYDTCLECPNINQCAFRNKSEIIYDKYNIQSHIVEGFIIDEYGVHIAENNAPDGWVYLTTYNSCSQFCQIYFSINEAKQAIDNK